jgi:hypothetical protein
LISGLQGFRKVFDEVLPKKEISKKKGGEYINA